MFSTRRDRLAIMALLILGRSAHCEDVHVFVSGGFATAYKQLAPIFESRTHNRLLTEWGPSMGRFPGAIPMRLDRGEPIDVVIMVGAAIAPLVEKGQVVRGSETLLARSKIAMAVRKGAPAPDISTVDALKRTLLNAKSVALSDSASGVYITNDLFRRLGIEHLMSGKSRMLPGSPVGELVARGEYEIGFQQNSELLPVPGVLVVGTIPEEVQLATVFSAAITSTAKAGASGQALARFLASSEAYSAIKGSGLEPIAKIE